VIVPIPAYQTLIRPLLSAVADGQPHRIRELVPKLADEFKLTAYDRSQLLPKQPVIDNRVNWATTYLKKANLLSTPQRGFVQITSAGQQVLNPDFSVRQRASDF
jgi:restriction system protein